ncbi:MAG: MFS transporter [Victivallaceae bacterium]
MQKFHCGTLTYTKIGLISLFVWLLWGDFCFTIMETVVPSILPLKLKALNCPNWVLGAIMTTIPNFLTISVAPYISVKSDRCRSRWGRRMPFIISTLPFLCISLIVLGWSEELATHLQRGIPFLTGFSPAAVTIALIGVIMVIFQFFNQFVNSIFNYHFNDVVPASHLGRFAGAFRIVGTGAAAIFNWFVFPLAQTHMHEIFLGAAILYGVGFGLMCFMIKEGEYPPLDEAQAKTGRIAALKIFFRESFCDRFYWYLFASAGVMAFAASAWSFTMFILLEMKMDLPQIGKYNTIIMIVGMIATYFAARFIDRWHPLRVYTYVVIFTMTGPAMNWIWIFIDLPGAYYFYLSLGAQLLYAFMNALSAACILPLSMRLFPHSRFGQFSSAQGIVRSLCAIVAGVMMGAYFDILRIIFANQPSPDFCYRFSFIWSTGACLLNFSVICIAYRRWNALGGDRDFHPPATWAPGGKEVQPLVKTTGFLSKYLLFALRLMDILMWSSLMLAAVMLLPLRHFGMERAFDLFLMAVLPASVLALVFWSLLAHSIRRDVALAKRGEAPVNGIPHHGLMMVFAIKFLLTLGLVAAQLIVSIKFRNDSYVVIFAMGNVVTNILLTVCTWVLVRMERGYSTKVDEASLAIWDNIDCEPTGKGI